MKNNLPKKWYIKAERSHKFGEFINWLKTQFDFNQSWNFVYNYYAFTGESGLFNGYTASCHYRKFEDIGCIKLTLDEFFELSKPIDEFILPEKYYIKKIDHPDYQLICDYFHEKSGYENFRNYDNLCYNPEWKVFKGYSAGLGNTTGFTEVSVEDFVKHVLNKNKETKMEQKLTRKQLITLYNADSCSKWKEIIGQYVRTFSAFDTDDVTKVIGQIHLDLLFKEGTDKQKKLVTGLGISLKVDKNAFVKEFPIDYLDKISNDLFNSYKFQIFAGSSSDKFNHLSGRAFLLSNSFKVITHDRNGETIIEIQKK